MATVNKDFKIKSGLIVEGTSATVNGNQILTENASDTYILNLIGGETLVKSVDTNTFTVDGSGNLTVNSGVFDAAGTADTAEQNAKNYTDNKLGDYTKTSDLDTTVDGYGYLKSGDLAGYATETYVDNSVNGLINDAGTSATEVWSSYKTSTEIGLAQGAAETYTDNAVANLVDSAPALLDTLNELAAAIADNPNYATDMATSLSNKQDVLSEGTGINIQSNTVSVDIFDLIGGNSAGYVPTSEKGGKIVVDELDLHTALDSRYDASGTAQGLVDNLTTADIPEGTPGGGLYFTDARVADYLASNGVVKSNISMYVSGGQLHVEAENGVVDSTTDDLTEGANNLYFQNSRVYNAIEGADIAPASVSINTFRKEEATQQSVANASTVNVHTFSYPYESAKYLVRVVGWVGGTKHSQITEILMTVDGNNNIAMTEYGNVHTSTEPLATFSASQALNTFTLTATTAVGGCEIIAAATMLSWAD